GAAIVLAGLAAMFLSIYRHPPQPELSRENLRRRYMGSAIVFGSVAIFFAGAALAYLSVGTLPGLVSAAGMAVVFGSAALVACGLMYKARNGGDTEHDHFAQRGMH
ncbi:MAG TPA: hypothetical protein VFI93_12605, partial [Rhizomicrobium sp.]|nr:hypothetical protein [Rhizomicrobium sp.]